MADQLKLFVNSLRSAVLVNKPQGLDDKTDLPNEMIATINATVQEHTHTTVGRRDEQDLSI